MGLPENIYNLKLGKMNNKKYFIITVDTEGDNLWDYKKGQIITTKNSLFIPRFQNLCNRYGFKPVYLTNYEMINDEDYLNFVKKVVNTNTGEVGIHIHAWNNPPMYDLKDSISDNTYLIEYPRDIMEEKFATTYNLIRNRLGVSPISHRAGRWAMNDIYFDILKKYDVLVDCSHTPHINWSRCSGAYHGGSDYRNVFDRPSFIKGVYEIPVTILPTKQLVSNNIRDLLYYIKVNKRLPFKTIWLRPAQATFSDMIRMVDVYDTKKEFDYLEFMIHSSELMPGGSPYFKTVESVEKLYETMRLLFDYLTNKGYEGATLKDYYYEHN